jgi:hypothetical protein
MLLTGCLGQARDKASIQALMQDLESHDFNLYGNWNKPESVDFASFMSDLDVALGYFADPISIMVDKKEKDSPSGTFERSGEFDREKLLRSEPEWDLSDYQDYIEDYVRRNLDEGAIDAFFFILVFVDANFDPLMYMAWDREDFSEMQMTESIVTVSGNAATWTKSYAVEGTIPGIGGNRTLEVSVGLEVDLKKVGSDWKISHVHIDWDRAIEELKTE